MIPIKYVKLLSVAVRPALFSLQGYHFGTHPSVKINQPKRSDKLHGLELFIREKRHFSEVEVQERDAFENLLQFWQTADKYAENERPTEALRLYMFCLNQIIHLEQGNNIYHIKLLHAIGQMQLQMHNYEEARKNIEDALKRARDLEGQNTILTASIELTLAQIFKSIGLSDEAAELYSKILDVFRAHYGLGYHELSLLKLKALEFYDAERALPLLENAFEVLFEDFGANSIYVFKAARSLAKCYRHLQRYEEAMDMSRLAIDVQHRVRVPRIEAADVYREYGMALEFNKNYKEAITAYIDSLELVESIDEDKRLCGAELTGRIGVALKKSGNISEAKMALLELWEKLQKIAETGRDASSECWEVEGCSEKHVVWKMKDLLNELKDLKPSYMQIDEAVLDKIYNEEFN